MQNMMQMLKKAQDVQKNMEKMQAELGQKEVEFSSGGGMVKAVAKGDGTLVRVKIDPQVVDPKDVAMLEDLVFAAVDGAIQSARDMMAKEMGKITSGLKIPGMKLPF
jgi:DNA-binding YbaB/EbfC family protein